MLNATQVEHVREISIGGPVGLARWEPKLDAVVCAHEVDPVGHGSDDRLEEGGCGDPRCALDQLGEQALEVRMYGGSIPSFRLRSR